MYTRRDKVTREWICLKVSVRRRPGGKSVKKENRSAAYLQVDWG